MSQAIKYVVNPMARFPRRWRAADGKPLRVLCDPAEGYVMARFKNAAPFTIRVSEILNADTHRFGPFTVDAAK
jgi:hypothetical protein